MNKPLKTTSYSWLSASLVFRLREQDEKSSPSFVDILAEFKLVCGTKDED
jgi:hypothetical protein